MFASIGAGVGLVLAFRLVIPAIRKHFEADRQRTSEPVMWRYRFGHSMALGVALSVICCGLVGHVVDVVAGTGLENLPGGE